MTKLLDISVGGKRKLEQIAVYLNKDKKVALEKWAAEEDRSVSWIVARLIDKAINEREAKEG